MQRLDGAAPTTVSDSKWPNPFLDPTAVCVQLVVAGLVTMIFRV